MFSEVCERGGACIAVVSVTKGTPSTDREGADTMGSEQDAESTKDGGWGLHKLEHLIDFKDVSEYWPKTIKPVKFQSNRHNSD